MCRVLEFGRRHVVACCIGLFHQFFVDGGWVYGTALHEESLFGGVCLRYDGPGYEIDNAYGGETGQAEQHGDDAPGQWVVCTEIFAKTAQYTAYNLVVGVAVEFAFGKEFFAFLLVVRRWRGRFWRRFAVLAVVGCSVGGCAGFLAFFVHLFGVANAVYDVLYVFYADGFGAFGFEVGEDFRHTVFDVVGYFVAAFALGKVGFHVGQILFEQLACIFVYGVKRTVKVDGDIFLHDAFLFVGVDLRRRTACRRVQQGFCVVSSSVGVGEVSSDGGGDGVAAVGFLSTPTV